MESCLCIIAIYVVIGETEEAKTSKKDKKKKKDDKDKEKEKAKKPSKMVKQYSTCFTSSLMWVVFVCLVFTEGLYKCV